MSLTASMVARTCTSDSRLKVTDQHLLRQKCWWRVRCRLAAGATSDPRLSSRVSCTFLHVITFNICPCQRRALRPGLKRLKATVTVQLTPTR